MRDEAHRFGITFHRNQRSRHFTSSELENIEGVGPKSVELLFKKFKAISAIKSASIEELSLVVGPDKAKKIRSYFDGKDTSAFVK